MNERLKVKVHATGNIRTISAKKVAQRPQDYTVIEQFEGELTPKPKPKATNEEKVAARKAELKAAEEKSAPAPEADNAPDEVVEGFAEESTDTTVDFGSLEVKELKAYADKHDVKYAKNAGKKKMIELLTK